MASPTKTITSPLSPYRKILVRSYSSTFNGRGDNEKMNKKMWERIRRKKNRHSQDLEKNSQELEKHSQESQHLEEHSKNLEEEALSSSHPPVISLIIQVPEKHKNQLVFWKFRNARTDKSYRNTGTDKSLTTMNVLIKEKKGLAAAGRFITKNMVIALEYVGLAPKGSQRDQSFLKKVAEGLVGGGK
nr:cycloartenol-C-24-methyltransferase [Tanacetum cinerariifolium]